MKPRRFRKGRAWNSEPLAKRLERNKRAMQGLENLAGKAAVAPDPWVDAYEAEERRHAPLTEHDLDWDGRERADGPA